MSTNGFDPTIPLPSGWNCVKLGDLLHGIEAGKSFTCQPRPADSGEWGVIKVSAMTWDKFNELENKAVPRGKSFDCTKEIQKGDILLSRSNTAELVGATVLVGHCRSRLLLSDKSMRLLYPSALCPQWLQGALASPEARRQMSQLATGTSDSMRNVSQEKVLSIMLRLPPANEQRRIVEAVDELLSDLDAGVLTLRRVQRKLGLYRTAVLLTAVEGAFTEQWRNDHSGNEHASALLARILVARRSRWEEDQLQKFAIAGRRPPQNWRARYREPVAPSTNELGPLPEGWCWATVDQCSERIQYGTSAKTKAAAGVPVLRMGNIRQDGTLVLDDLKYLPCEHSEFPELILRRGDLLFNRTNSAELVGKTGLYAGLPDPCSFASYLIRIRPLPGVCSAYVGFCLNSALGRRWIKQVASQTVGQANVNGTKLAAFAFPLPPLSEQETIVETVEDQLSVIDHLDRELKTKLRSAQSLRQTTLRHAFTGELVPQHADDDPASDVLKQISAEREERVKQTAARKAAAKAPRAGYARSH